MPLHRVQAPALRPLKDMSHFSSACNLWHRKNSSNVTVRWMRSGEASSSGLVSKPSLPNLTLLSALGVLPNFFRHNPVKLCWECEEFVFGHRARSCALCWHSCGAAGELCPESSRLVLTGGGRRTPGCQKNVLRGEWRCYARFSDETFGCQAFTPPSCDHFRRVFTMF